MLFESSYEQVVKKNQTLNEVENSILSPKASRNEESFLSPKSASRTPKPKTYKSIDEGLTQTLSHLGKSNYIPEESRQDQNSFMQ